MTVAAVAALSATGVVAAVAVAPPPANLNHTAGLAKVGPIDETNGFPLTYTDTNGTRLELCTDVANPNCIVGALPTPGSPLVFPTNYPDEAFYSKADATIDVGNGNKALLDTGTEAAFAGGVQAGQQITFGRIRIRVSGLVDNGAYKVTHPFGTDNFVSTPGAFKGINSTEDIGALTPDGVFDQTLGAREAPFLKWDPAVAPAAPGGYLGDPTTTHPVTGSPYNTNMFRIEGPVGSFPGSTQQCANAALGQSPTATDDCIETNLFTIQGKIATRAGVQVTKAVYQNKDTGHTIDLFAKSEPGQQMMVTGTGISQTLMKGDAKGNYFARVYADGAPPADLAVTNQTDKPASVDHVDQKLFGDAVHINSAVYDTDSSSFQVTAQSGDPAAKLSLTGYPGATSTTSNTGAVTWNIPSITVPPSDAIVTSDKGGVATSDVVVTGAQFASSQVKAAISASSTAVQTGAPVTLDSTLSTGTISSQNWAITGGPAGATLSSASAAGTTFTASTPGTYTVKLTVNGTGTGNTSSDQVTIVVSGATATPVADAGPDQTGIVPTSTVNLDGTNSKFAKTFSWAAPAGITLTNPTTANPTFVMPVTTTPTTYTFTLTITDQDNTVVTDTVNVTNAPDKVDTNAGGASYKAGSLEWRVRGNAQYCSANNLLTFVWNRPDGTKATIGTTTPAVALGVCTYDFRAKNVATNLRPTSAGTITVTSALGGTFTGPFSLL